MRKCLLSLLTLLLSCANVFAQTQIDKSEFTSLYQNKSFKTIGVHDPSIFWDTKSKTYYIFGTHYSAAKTTDLRNWTAVSNYYNTSPEKAFKSCPTHTVMRCLPGKTEQTQAELPSFDAAAFCATYAGITVGSRKPTTEANWIGGDMWAPDIIYNPNMGKYCLYLSLNGDYWASAIVLLTADKVEGPYTYQAPIVFGGFDGQARSGKSVDYKKTDLEVVLGPLTGIPSRYKTDRWGSYYPNCIDPCVLFDEDGELWMSYGSWSGGIFMLKLDKNTGLRDYTYTYAGTSSSPSETAKSDAYFGQKIAGGAYVSGEGSYIQRIGNHYFLFMTYGGLESNKGYEMRVFRSDNITGPYKDAGGQAATFDSYVLNYGPNAKTNKGMKVIGSMNGWANMTVAECAQGHCSSCVDEQGRSFLFFHTRFNNGNEGFQVRSYQLYLNKSGWLCTAPFQFAGEEATDDYLADHQPYSLVDVEGDYHILVHPYKLDHENYAASTPKLIHLAADGKVTGDYSGTWKYTDEGKSYITLTLRNVNGVNSTNFEGVVVEQTLENNTAKTLCFTTVCNTSGNSNCGVPCWGYKLQPQSAIAYNYQKLKDTAFKSYASVNKNVQLMYDTYENTSLTWESSRPDIISNEGKYNPDTAAVSLTLTARLACGDYYWEQQFSARAAKATEVEGDQYSGLAAYYDFESKPTVNLYDNEQKVTYGRSSTSAGKSPVLENDYARFGQVVHQYQGAKGQNSFSRMANPLCGNDTISGFTVSMWVKCCDSKDYDGVLWGFFNSTIASASGPRLFLTGNSYVRFDDNASNWFEINNPAKKKVTSIGTDTWNLITFTYSAENGYMLYKNGTKYLATNMVYEGSAGASEFDRSKVLDFVKSIKYFYLGLGGLAGSAEAYFDDVMIYSRELSAADVKGLNTLMNRDTDFSPSSRGDIDFDGEITIADLTLLMDAYLSGAAVESHAACDIDADGKITVSDVTALLSLYLDR